MIMRHLVLVAVLVFAQAVQSVAAEPEVNYRLGNWEIYGDSPHYLDFGVGAFDADEDKAAAARVEFRLGRKFLSLGPALGLLVNNDDGYFIFGGVYADIAYRRLVITPLVGAGGYEAGDGKDLGGTFQFRTSITFSYQFENLYRLGVQIGHISNAGTHDHNPSEQDGFVILAIHL